jgi:integrase
VFRARGLDHLEDVYVMRHTFCSILCNDGSVKRDIAELMGHDNEIMFQKVYAHRLDPEDKEKELADKMEKLMSKRPGKDKVA